MYVTFEVLHGRSTHSSPWVISANADINYTFKLFNALPLCVMSSVDCFCFLAFVNAFEDCIWRAWENDSIPQHRQWKLFSYLCFFNLNTMLVWYIVQIRLFFLMIKFVLGSDSPGGNTFFLNFSELSCRHFKENRI